MTKGLTTKQVTTRDKEIVREKRDWSQRERERERLHVKNKGNQTPMKTKNVYRYMDQNFHHPSRNHPQPIGSNQVSWVAQVFRIYGQLSNRLYIGHKHNSLKNARGTKYFKMNL